MDKTLLNTLHVKTSEKIANLRGQRDFARTNPKLFKLLDHLVEKHSLEVYASTESYGTYVYATVKNLTGLKDERLAELLNSMIYAEPDRESTSDHAAAFSRQYTFEWHNPENYGQVINVTITAEFGEDSETCKRVITGYREPSKEPTPIYELRCEGDVTDATGVRIDQE